MSRLLTAIGLIASVIYTVAIYALVSDRLSSLKSMELNQVGDFLAGAFGPIALLWLILGYLQQGIELKLNTKALELQVAELRSSVEHQRELVEVTKKQFEADLEILRHERSRAEQQIQPKFSPEAITGHHQGDRSSFTWSIKNLGAPISNVTLAFSTKMQKFEPAHLVEWLEGESRRVIFTFPDWKVADTELTIAYIDQHGKPGAKVFRLAADTSGSYPKLQIVRPDL